MLCKPLPTFKKYVFLESLFKLDFEWLEFLQAGELKRVQHDSSRQKQE